MFRAGAFICRMDVYYNDQLFERRLLGMSICWSLDGR